LGEVKTKKEAGLEGANAQLRRNSRAGVQRPSCGERKAIQEVRKTDTDINSNIGVTAHGVRPECGATTDAGADERNADDSAGEREENVPAQEQSKPQAKPETGTNVGGQTKIKGRAPDVNKNEPGARSSTSQTNVTGTNQTTTVNKQEFRSRHNEVFSLGRHPKEFFVQRFGASHFRLIGNTYFVFVDGCWVAVDVDGFVYAERMICVGDPDFIEVD
jgi:hypothetical protein